MHGADCCSAYPQQQFLFLFGLCAGINFEEVDRHSQIKSSPQVLVLIL